MFDTSFFPDRNGNTTVDWICGTGNYVPWHKPRGKTMVSFLIAGRGGNGGRGHVGAAAAAGGGGGGGSGGICRTVMPLNMLPDTLFIYTGPSASASSGETVVRAASPTTVLNNNAVVCRAPGGSNGSNSVGTTGGAGGGAGGTATASTAPLGWAFSTVFAGHAGLLGAAQGNAGSDHFYPQTGIMVCGGAGGGGIATSGAAGGKIFQWAPYPAIPGGVPGASATARTPDASGGLSLFSPQYAPIFYGGAGSASGWVGATGDGLIQARGGHGAPGCGGSGAGAIFTGGTLTSGGDGGPGFCLITCW